MSGIAFLKMKTEIISVIQSKVSWNNKSKME